MTDAYLQASLDVRRGAFGLALDLAVDEHARCAVIGPNGAGKSTLLAALAGHLPLSSGFLRLDGRTLAACDGASHRRTVPPHRRRIVWCDQDPHLFGHLSVRGNIEYGPASLGRPRPEVASTAAGLIERFGLGDLADRRVPDLSGGQAQRVALARALATAPRLLLLDEPFAALDVTAAAGLRAELAALLDERGTTTLFVSHAAVDVAGLADRVIVLEAGRIVDDGSAARVLRQPRSAFAAELAGVCVLEGTTTGGGFVTSSGWTVPLDAPVPAGVTRLFVPPEAVGLTPGEGPLESGATLVRVEALSSAPAGVAVTVRPAQSEAEGSSVRLFATVTAVWLAAGQPAHLRIDCTRIRAE